MYKININLRWFLSVLLCLIGLTHDLAYAETKISLRDKIGQMLLIGFEGKHIDAQSSIVSLIEEHNIGGVILFDFNARTETYDKNIESPAQVKELNTNLQRVAIRGHKKYHRPRLPLLLSVDYEGGAVNRLSERYGFPPTRSAFDVGQMNLEDVEPIAERMAKTLKKVGFNLNFAPVLDVNVNPDNPIIGKKNRSFSDDPVLVELYASIYSRHFLKKNIQCAYKHFPGHGSATGDSHMGFVDVTDTWKTYELLPYTLMLNQPSSCGMIMTAHVVNKQLDDSGLPATLSHKMLTGLLREQLHFKGVIITDDMQMKAIRDHYGLDEAVTLAINAGADMITIANALPGKRIDPVEVIDLILRKVKSGEIREARINDAYQRIVALKQSY